MHKPEHENKQKIKMKMNIDTDMDIRHGHGHRKFYCHTVMSFLKSASGTNFVMVYPYNSTVSAHYRSHTVWCSLHHAAALQLTPIPVGWSKKIELDFL
jgi:hypothetical protein